MTVKAQMPQLKSIPSGYGKYWETILPTFIERWPRELRLLSIPSSGVQLTLEEAEVLGLNQTDYFETWLKPGELDDFLSLRRPDPTPVEEKLERAFAFVDPKGFVRLGSRSAKDTMRWHEHGPRVNDGREAMLMLLDASERINDDLHLMVANDYRPWVFIRQWLDIEPWEEFRCFVYDKHLVGISQYFYDKPYEHVIENAAELERVISSFMNFDVIPALPVRHAVVDLVVRHAVIWKIKLLEINPFLRVTDPCLFDWNKLDEFTGLLKYVNEER